MYVIYKNVCGLRFSHRSKSARAPLPPPLLCARAREQELPVENQDFNWKRSSSVVGVKFVVVAVVNCCSSCCCSYCCCSSSYCCCCCSCSNCCGCCCWCCFDCFSCIYRTQNKRLRQRTWTSMQLLVRCACGFCCCCCCWFFCFLGNHIALLSPHMTNPFYGQF